MAEGSREQAIGRNVAFFRGERSQKSVADAMRERGHKWSQATVWAVEKGDRPLRLAEADDLAKLLGCNLWELSAGSDELQTTLRLAHHIRQVTVAHESAVTAMSDLMKRRADAEFDRINARELLVEATGGVTDLAALSGSLEMFSLVLDAVTPESVLPVAKQNFIGDYGPPGPDEEVPDGEHQEEA